MVKIEVPNSLLCGERYLPSAHVIFVAIDNRPKRLPLQRPAAREHTIKVRGIERLPIGANEERRNSTLDRRHAPRRLSVAWSNPIPDAPDVFPALPTHTVKESK